MTLWLSVQIETTMWLTFANLRKANLSLNPKKCVFGVHKGKVLGCLVSTKGIEANLTKSRP